MRIFLFLIGFGLTTIGCTYIITYLNLFSFGYSFSEYISFIFKRYECFYVLIGFCLLTITIYWKGESNDLRL